MARSMALMQEKLSQFKSDLFRYYPHKKIAEYTRLMDALEEFEEYAFEMEDDKPKVAMDND